VKNMTAGQQHLKKGRSSKNKNYMLLLKEKKRCHFKFKWG